MEPAESKRARDGLPDGLTVVPAGTVGRAGTTLCVIGSGVGRLTQAQSKAVKKASDIQTTPIFMPITRYHYSKFMP